MTKEKINLAQILYSAYPHSDLLPINPDQDCRNLQSLLVKVTNENIGDGLFKFMVVESVEGGESTLTGAIRVMDRAKQDVEAVLHALQAANDDPNNVFHNNKEDPQIIDIERAKESCRIGDSHDYDYRLYCAAAEYLASEGRKIFTGHMNGGLWNGRCMDACILSKKKNDKAAYEFLLKFGDQYAQAISNEQKDVWQKIKEIAAATLNPATP